MNLPPELWGTWPAKELTAPERELLRAALANRGAISVYPGGQEGRVIQVGERTFADPADPSVRARYVEAFERLWRRGLILYEAIGLYTLSGSGFELARQSSGAANVTRIDRATRR